MSKFGEYRINNMAGEKIWPPYKYQNGKKKWLRNNYPLLCYDNIHGLNLVSGRWEHVWPKQISYWQKPNWATLAVRPTLTTCTTYTRTCFPLIVAPMLLTVTLWHDASDIFQLLWHICGVATQRCLSAMQVFWRQLIFVFFDNWLLIILKLKINPNFQLGPGLSIRPKTLN